ncbi:Transmembrane protein [Rhodanobacter sp. Root179]|jgi:hypothetical protein|uniref:DUF6326 family protein n=1 Tax=unclassified Rhodanobacter TaxID=2621553 RepID=UPI0006F1D4A1|nr:MULTISPECIES: DUF6326 family protein [unclassified Rhodanobacter]KQZ74627.1 hypothetical protein ASD55_09595 [Rhodanobacter sp. Root561]KRB33817.1 hypothetical protein ASD82_15915 [Rhodanobacter sp. Root179]
MSATSLVDIKLHVRFKLSALWTALMFCYIYGDYFGLYVPGKLQGMLGGEGPVGPVSEATLVGTALLLAVPGLMVFLSLLLPPRLCRWLNIGLGLFYTAIMLLTMPGAWWFYIVLGVIEVALSLLIAAMAWRWPRS